MSFNFLNKEGVKGGKQSRRGVITEALIEVNRACVRSLEI